VVLLVLVYVLLTKFNMCCSFFTDAKNVASKKHELFEVNPHVALLQTWPETLSCAVLVKGMGNTTFKELAMLYFENERRTGGGPIEDYFEDEERGTVVITYQNRESKSNAENYFIHTQWKKRVKYLRIVKEIGLLLG